MNADSGDTGSDLKSWAIITGLTAAVFVWGLLIFFTVGDKGLPPWDYTILPDVPGKSMYSTQGARNYSGEVPKPGQKAGDIVLQQHVRERPTAGNVLEQPGGGK
jgi:hypothetical protein